ncbi:YceI family protein [Thiomonas bhubaneswarensis]|uniref:Polyisoprenoid-binding periplasmic protein YceI n=1 Tax=Thiomonas bhubaneswarensis TaxID=339866 RepID=A0A0K6HRT9_9BURK|nr:YceI family protein [Thiomonas bhubaneswarensis]CUA93579.1 Polyisoprenoid-binding periplasmic protein YceI [Thiomonas bhubaneswarensis]
MMHTSPRRSATAAVVASLALVLAAAPTWASEPSAPQPYAHKMSDPAGSYRVDPDHSGVQFTLGHAGVGRFTGVFKSVTGTYTFDPADPAKDQADIVIPVKSLDTFLPQRDTDLLATPFFDAAAHPDIRFVSTRYVPQDKTHGKLYGNLTLRGVTHPVTFDVKLIGAGDVPYLPKPWGGYLSGFVATATINRMDFGMTAFAAGLGHDVAVRVEVEGVRSTS